MNYTISFVGNDYYCESGRGVDESGWILYFNNLLWDGEDCHGYMATCCTSPKKPWFVKALSETVNDDIELSIFDSNNRQIIVWGTTLDLVELYIK